MESIIICRTVIIQNKFDNKFSLDFMMSGKVIYKHKEKGYCCEENIFLFFGNLCLL